MKNIISSVATALVVSVIVCSLAIAGGSKNIGGSISTIAQTFGNGFIIPSGAATSTVASPVTNSSTYTFGSSGSPLTQIIKGTCNLVGGTVAATSSAPADCAVTGVVDGDLVFAQLATSTAGGAITGARASTTAGYITVRLMNLAGAAKDTTYFGTSTEYWIVR